MGVFQKDAADNVHYTDSATGETRMLVVSDAPTQAYLHRINLAELNRRLALLQRRLRRQSYAESVLSQRYAQRRVGGVWCRPPNTLAASAHTLREGCFRLCFSTEGDFLAAALSDGDAVRVRVFHLLLRGTHTLHSVHLLPVVDGIGHLSIVHDLSWSTDDAMLITSSSDYTARIFDFTRADREAEAAEVQAEEDEETRISRHIAALLHSLALLHARTHMRTATTQKSNNNNNNN